MATKPVTPDLSDCLVVSINEAGIKDVYIPPHATLKWNDWPRPIPVTERLPQDGQPCFAYSDGWDMCWYDGSGKFSSSDGTPESVTHWLPLPPPP